MLQDLNMLQVQRWAIRGPYNRSAIFTAKPQACSMPNYDFTPEILYFDFLIQYQHTGINKHHSRSMYKQRRMNPPLGLKASRYI